MFTGEPVQPSLRSGLTVSMNSQRPRSFGVLSVRERDTVTLHPQRGRGGGAPLMQGTSLERGVC